MSMTPEERTRVYCCLKDCPRCSAVRGQFCHGTNRRVWLTSYHWERSPGRMARRPQLKKRYQVLVRQVIAGRLRGMDHEMREG